MDMTSINGDGVMNTSAEHSGLFVVGHSTPVRLFVDQGKNSPPKRNSPSNYMALVGIVVYFTPGRYLTLEWKMSLGDAVVPAGTTLAPSRCCKLTEGVYTWLGCISVTLFFLGVATIKFLRYIAAAFLFHLFLSTV